MKLIRKEQNGQVQGEVELESNEREILTNVSYYGVKEKHGAREIPRNSHEWPQLRLLAMVEVVPELTFSCGGCPHRSFFQWLMEPDAEIQDQTPG